VVSQHKFSHFHSSAVEVSIILGYPAVSPGDCYPTFWGSIVVSSAEVACPILVFIGHLTLDDGTATLYWIFSTKAQHPTRTDNSNVTTLRNDHD